MAQRSMMMVRRIYMQIGMFTLLTALVWIGVGVFLAITKTEIPNADKDLLSPLNASIDEATLQKLSERITLTQIQSETLVTQQASGSATSTSSTQLEQEEL